ncbi:MAG: hypothetical protein FWE19_03630 [Oscillospiraceae bacterium]|nr:hypothetical protein [Oscillospiraceae bacterium]
MLEIKPCTDLKLLAEYCGKCGKMPGPQFYLYLAKKGELLLAAGLFEIGSSSVDAVFYQGDETDPWLLDAVLRAGLNYAASHDIPTGRLPEEFRQEHRTLFAKLNYPPQAEFNITNFFGKYKNCGAV